MPLPPADSPLRPLLDTLSTRPSPWVWSVGQPEVGGRLRLPAPAIETVGVQRGTAGRVHGRCHQAGLVLRPTEPADPLLRVDSAGRLTLPMWLRGRGPLAIGTNTAAAVIVIAPTGVLDPIGDLLSGVRR